MIETQTGGISEIKKEFSHHNFPKLPVFAKLCHQASPLIHTQQYWIKFRNIPKNHSSTHNFLKVDLWSKQTWPIRQPENKMSDVLVNYIRAKFLCSSPNGETGEASRWAIEPMKSLLQTRQPSSPRYHPDLSITRMSLLNRDPPWYTDMQTLICQAC